MLAVKTLAKGQIVIPASIRKQLGIKVGSLFELRTVDNHIELYPLPSNPIASLRGSLKSKESLADKLIHEHRLDVGKHNG